MKRRFTRKEVDQTNSLIGRENRIVRQPHHETLVNESDKPRLLTRRTEYLTTPSFVDDRLSWPFCLSTGLSKHWQWPPFTNTRIYRGYRNRNISRITRRLDLTQQRLPPLRIFELSRGFCWKKRRVRWGSSGNWSFKKARRTVRTRASRWNIPGNRRNTPKIERFWWKNSDNGC